MIRALLPLAAGVGVGVALTFAADHDRHKALKVTQLSRRDIIEKLDGKAASATVVEVTFEPGQQDSPHHHAGPVFGYVLEGEYEHALDDEPVKKYKAGDTFYEPRRSAGHRRGVAAVLGRAPTWGTDGGWKESYQPVRNVPRPRHRGEGRRLAVDFPSASLTNRAGCHVWSAPCVRRKTRAVH